MITVRSWDVFASHTLPLLSQYYSKSISFLLASIWLAILWMVWRLLTYSLVGRGRDSKERGNRSEIDKERYLRIY